MNGQKRGLHARIVVRTAAQVVAAAALGLVGLPALLADSRAALQDWIWLSLAVACAIWLIVLAPAMARVLAQLVSRLQDARDGDRVVNALAVGWLVVAVLEVLVIQAILRRPLVRVVGIQLEPYAVEVSVAAAALLVLLVLLARLHQTARPLVEGLVWSALNTVLATTGSDANAASPTRPDPTASSRAFTVVADERPAAGAAQTQAAGAEQTVTAETRAAMDATRVRGS
jgi:hypothetical protein